MKMWPFGNRLETRADYTDTLIAGLLSRAQGKTLAVPTATGALEACSGLVGRGFVSAEVSGPDSLTRALSPSVMEMIGRSLIRTGEIVFLVDSSSGSLRLIPAQTHDVEGGPDPSGWSYSITAGGPSRTIAYDSVDGSSVLHFRYAADPLTPWRGNGPIEVASAAGRLSSETVNALANEASGPVGRLLAVPVDGQDATVEGLKTDIANARGRTAIVEGGDWGSSGDAKVSLQSARFRCRATSWARRADVSVLPGGLCRMRPERRSLGRCWWGWGDSGSMATGPVGVLSPLGKLVEAELQEKLDDTVTLSWQELRASDLSGRARAFQSMVGGGMDVTKAISIAGPDG